jgi:trk system potassium uptake protein TrkH
VPVIPKPRTGGPQTMVLVYGFAGLIAIGTILLALPISSASGHATSLVDAFFTATSSVCVTGLVVVDTGDYWNLFGQIIIFVLIQLGGFGFMTSATLFLLAFGRRIGLRERLLIGESMGMQKMGGLIAIVKRSRRFLYFLFPLFIAGILRPVAVEGPFPLGLGF